VLQKILFCKRTLQHEPVYQSIIFF